jgi:SHS2 domain-containing protein
VKNFIFLDHTADIAVELQADSEENLFRAGIEAYRHIMFDGIPLRGDDTVALYLSENSLEELIAAFLNELNYMVSVKGWAVKNAESTRLILEDGIWKFECILSGGVLGEEHYPNYEIKAAAYHDIRIKENNGIYSITIIFDV